MEDKVPDLVRVKDGFESFLGRLHYKNIKSFRIVIGPNFLIPLIAHSFFKQLMLRLWRNYTSTLFKRGL